MRSGVDNTNEIKPVLAMNAEIGSNTDTTGVAIDLQGVHAFTFVINAVDYDDGTYTPAIEESDDVGFSSPSDVEAARLLGTVADATISASQSEGDTVKSLGAFDTKQFVRLKQTSTGISGTGAQVVADAILNLQLDPSKGQ